MCVVLECKLQGYDFVGDIGAGFSGWLEVYGTLH